MVGSAMIVCSCNVFSDGDVRAAIEEGPAPLRASVAQIYRELGHVPRCGRCARTIRNIITESCPLQP